MTDWSKKTPREFWDVRTGAIDRYSKEIRGLSREQREHALSEITRSVRGQTAALPDRMLIDASIEMTDHLYRSLSADGKGGQEWVWDETLECYLAAAAATVQEQLRARGLQLRYIVDNPFPASEIITGPVTFFRDWFQAAGFIYVCPRAIAVGLLKALERDEPLDRFPRYLGHARRICRVVLEHCRERGSSFVFLDAEATDDSISMALEQYDAPNVICVLRRQAPAQSNEISISPPPHPHR
jgi:hypothetical protein